MHRYKHYTFNYLFDEHIDVMLTGNFRNYKRTVRGNRSNGDKYIGRKRKVSYCGDARRGLVLRSSTTGRHRPHVPVLVEVLHPGKKSILVHLFIIRTVAKQIFLRPEPNNSQRLANFYKFTLQGFVILKGRVG